jgi:hypothetical protein
MSVKYVADSFEDGIVNWRIWKDKQIEPHQISFSSDSADGNRSIVITTADGDGGKNCDEPCQRAELRLKGHLRPVYGQEIWYSFAFKASGDIQPVGSKRTVIGQWKAPGDECPFLAQRFDNGVFHITIQDGPNRSTVASAKGNPHRLMEFQDLIADISSNPSLGMPVVNAERALADLKALKRHQGSRHYASDRTSQYKSLYRTQEESAGLDIKRISQLFDEFHFIQDLETYVNLPRVMIYKKSPKKLPDPKSDWVSMMYRIRGGRTDNNYGPDQEGEIDIWANGELMAEIRGNIGYRLTAPPDSAKMFFKFGIYRNPLPYTIRFHFDRFRQGSTQAEVM